MKSISNEIIEKVIVAIQQYNRLAQHLINLMITETKQPYKAELQDGQYYRLLYAETIDGTDLLSDNWRYDVHGEHCQFVNEKSGQEVEVSLGDADSVYNLDPYFFFRFLETTNEYVHLSKYFEKPFHEMLELFKNLEERNVLKHIHGVEYRKM